MNCTRASTARAPAALGWAAGGDTAQVTDGRAGVAHGDVGLEWGQGGGRGWSAGSFPRRPYTRPLHPGSKLPGAFLVAA